MKLDYGARATRTSALLACLIGVMMMSAGRFNPHVPPVFAPIGLGVILVGWALLAFSAFRRGRIPLRHPGAKRNQV